MTVDGVVIVHWPRDTNAAVVRQIAIVTAAACREFGRPVAFIGCVHSLAKVPGVAAASEYMRFSRTFATACRAQRAVLSPASPHRRLQIAVVEAMTAFNHVAMEICDSLEYAIRAAAVHVAKDGDAIIRAARVRGAFD